MESLPCVYEKKYSITTQIIVSFFCAVLDLLMMSLPFKFQLPLYLDMIFTLVAVYFGWVSTLFTPFLFHLLAAVFSFGSVKGSAFIICSLSGAIILKIFLQKYKKIQILDLVLLSVVMSLVIAIEGGIIFTLVSTNFKYEECAAVNYLTVSLLLQRIPFFLSSILARLPTSFLDKTLSVCACWLIMLGLQRKIPSIR